LRRPFRARRRTVERYLDALEPLGIRNDYRRPRFHLDADLAARARERLAAAGLGERSYAALVPGSLWATKRWPVDRYAELARRIRGELGLGVAVLGSTSERGLCTTVAAASGALDLSGEMGLGETAAAISMARLFVGNDSGPLHMAMALDVPSVAIFGPTDPSQFDFEGHSLVYEDLECSACSFYGGERCRLSHWRCMNSIDAERVFDAACRLLDSRRRP
jgi:ADP-heptose:LPS heptosyltransferase